MDMRAFYIEQIMRILNDAADAIPLIKLEFIFKLLRCASRSTEA